ncbi:MAG: hypothetical protein EHM40_21915 [Chloroflexi bacterium]|nr:MAG: hypothetical protein EHM40_21915 [Chloroflexota bacterium]
MKSNPENSKPERERQDWGIVLIILLFGFLCVIVSAQWALRFSPNWQMDADMGSNVDLNSEFLTSRPVGFIEPVDPAILTQPPWGKVFLTAGAKFVAPTPLPPSTATVPTEPETVAVATNTIAVTNTGTTAPTNTFVWLPLPATATRKPKDPPADTPTDTPLPSASLAITNSDGAALYLPGSLRSYTIVVSNPLGPSNVTGATVTNILSGPVFSTSWSCLAAGTTCGAGGPGNISDVVDLPVGSSITYTVNVTADNPAAGDLVNTASVSLPAGYVGPSPVTLIDTDAVINAGGPPAGMETYDSINCALLNAGDPPITFSVSAAIDDDAGPDLIYYEEPQAPGILMDKIVIEISDGLNWYTLLNWGDDAQNSNTTNLLLPILGPPGACGWSEIDNCEVDAGALWNNTGILLNIPASLQDGLTSYIRITVLPEGTTPPNDGNVCIDALVPY